MYIYKTCGSFNCVICAQNNQLKISYQEHVPFGKEPDVIFYVCIRECKPTIFSEPKEFHNLKNKELFMPQELFMVHGFLHNIQASWDICSRFLFHIHQGKFLKMNTAEFFFF